MVDLSCHVEDEELERYSLGSASEEESARLEEHLLVCDRCRARLEEYDLIADSMAAAAAQWRSEHPRPQQKTWSLTRLLLPLAAILSLALTGMWINYGRQTHAPALALALNATRGAVTAARAPALRPLQLRPDLTGIAPFPRYDLEIVDHVGGKVAHAQTDGHAPFRLPGLQSGMYFVRLYSPAGDLLREYALSVSDQSEQRPR